MSLLRSQFEGKQWSVPFTLGIDDCEITISAQELEKAKILLPSVIFT